MPKSQYDAIITNIGDSGFTGYYTKEINMKLSDGMTVINVYKPGRCFTYNNEFYKDAMIELSGNATNNFTYSDLRKISMAIEEAINYLNLENINIIDRNKIGTYETIIVEQPQKNKTEAIKFSNLEIGGIYLDEKKNRWLFLGEGTLLKNNVQENRANNEIYSTYIYMKCPESLILTEIADNEFVINDYFSKPDTYSSKKRFFEKVEQLSYNPNLPLRFKSEYFEFQILIGVKPKTLEEQFNSSTFENKEPKL